MTLKTSRDLLLAGVLSMAIACKGDGGPPAVDGSGGASDGSDGDDTAVSGQALVDDVQAAPTDNAPTVIRVRFSTEEATRVRVEFGESDALGQSTPTSPTPSLSHEFLLLGLPSNMEVSFQVVLLGDDGEERGLVRSVRTGPMPSAFPKLDLEVADEPLDTYVLTTLAGAAWGPVIYDGLGRPVWFHAEERGFNTYRARLSRDGRAILYNAVAVGEPDLINESGVVRVSLDGTVKAEYLVPLATHDFVEMPDGDIVIIAYDIQEHGGVELRGDKLVRYDVDTGETYTVWSSWDVFDPDTQGYDDGDDTWTHCNAIDYDDEQDVFYLSVRDLGSIVKIDASTGETLWGISGHANDFTFIGDETNGWELQHQFEVEGDRLRVFDNGTKDRASSYIREYTLDEDAMTAELTSVTEADPSLFVWALGDVDTLEGGDLLVTYSTAGLFRRLSPEGEVLWELKSPLSYAAGYSSLETSLYGQ